MEPRSIRDQMKIDKFLGKSDPVVVGSVEEWEEANGVEFTCSEKNCLQLLNSPDAANLELGLLLAESQRPEVLQCAKDLIPHPGLMFWINYSHLATPRMVKSDIASMHSPAYYFMCGAVMAKEIDDLIKTEFEEGIKYGQQVKEQSHNVQKIMPSFEISDPNAHNIKPPLKYEKSPKNARKTSKHKPFYNKFYSGKRQ